MGVPLLAVDALRALESAAARSLAPGTLMQRAGAAAADALAQRLGPGSSHIAVVCGPGNNGGDGYVCATELAARGHQVECFEIAAASADDARAAAQSWRSAGGAIQAKLDSGRCFDAVVDALFGIGLSRAPGGVFAAAIDWINAQSTSLRVALDIPSGLDADRGCWVGPTAGVAADLTVTFLAAKPGLYTGAGCDAAGDVVVDALGIDASIAPLLLLAPDDFDSVTAPRMRDSHKGDYGNVGILGGGTGMVGAALLAARAALRLGAGRVFVECTGARDLQFDPLFPELMLQSVRKHDRLDTVVAGCGLGTDAEARRAVEWALGAPCPAILDADALNLLARDAALKELLRNRRAPAVITPHPLEAARLLGVSAAEVQRDRIACALRLAAELHAIVVLKGAGTVVACEDRRAWINPTGSPALATPGSGDVLSGIIGSLAAQGYSPLEAVLGAVWLHGKAANVFGADVGLVAGEIAAGAARSLADLRKARARQSVRTRPA